GREHGDARERKSIAPSDRSVQEARRVLPRLDRRARCAGGARLPQKGGRARKSGAREGSGGGDRRRRVSPVVRRGRPRERFFFRHRGQETESGVTMFDPVSEITIDAPPAVVWRILTDTSQYEAWNPLVVRYSGELRRGARVTINLMLEGRRTPKIP